MTARTAKKAARKPPTTTELLSMIESTNGNKCHICDDPAHYRVQLKDFGHYACVGDVQLVVEDVVHVVCGSPITIESAALYEKKHGGTK